MVIAKVYPDLKFRFIWLFIGYLLISLVVYLSLTSDPLDVELSLPYEDKFFHCLAYFVLMAWFAQIYHHNLQRNMIALAFVTMGVALEYLQSFDPARMSEFADVVANSTGVVLGLMLALTKAKFTLLNFEKWIR
jgi:VanZ family protein